MNKQHVPAFVGSNQTKNSLLISRLKITTISIFVLVVVFSLWAVPILALETGIEYGTYIGLTTQDIRITIMKIVRIFLGLVGVIAIIIIMYGGYIWMTSAGNPEKIDQAKKILRNAGIGLLIIFLAFAIVRFIINALSEGLGLGPTGPPGQPPGCEGCGHLGAGIIESVYPAPYAEGVVKNINVIVTFKVEMDPSTIINDESGNGIYGDCLPAGSDCDNLKPGSVYIFKSDDRNDFENKSLDPETVRVRKTGNNRTFTFDPDGYLDTDENLGSWYEVRLTNEIKKDGGDSAFLGAGNNYFQWPFQVIDELDLDPVEVSNVWPEPDDEGDNYAEEEGVAAEGSIEVLSQPQVAESASASINLGFVGPEMTLSGTYNCLVDGTINVSVDMSGNGIINSVPDILGLNSSWDPSEERAVLGCNLILQKTGAGDIEFGNSWTISVITEKETDTLTVTGKTYTFVSSGATGNQINIGGLPAPRVNTASNIADKINDVAEEIPDVRDDPNPQVPVTADADVRTITLTAKIANESGNSITIQASGNWAELCNIGWPRAEPPVGRQCDRDNPRINLSGGAKPVFTAQPRKAPDKSRNAIIKIDFNEAIDPTEVENAITVQYNSETDPDNPPNWTTVTGSYLKSNQYRTVEFLSESQCGVCSDTGDPCSSPAECGGVSCDLITNSCGEKVYCLPVLADGDTTTAGYDPTRYRVIIKAGLLKDCTTAGCLETNFSQCVGTPGSDTGKVCANQSPYEAENNYFYPEVRDNPSGITDAANNSFNGNENTYSLSGKTVGNAEGPGVQSGQGPYYLNQPDADSQGDNLVWSFYINKTLDLIPPNITEIGPTVGASGVSLTAPIEAEFDELLMGSTLKPGSGYRDGYCWCDATNSTCPTDQTCDTVIEKCKSDSGEQEFCTEDKECSPGSGVCWNRKYVTLVDWSTFPVGWWISHQNFDTEVPLDGYADITRVYIRHTKFAEVTQYGGEFGSGIKDVYQNCYLPSGGPDALGTDTCPVTDTQPYCCNGVAMTEAEWAADPDCFTGY